eukprot:1446658-Alexandrium_andersonii.AAC.1
MAPLECRHSDDEPHRPKPTHANTRPSQATTPTPAPPNARRSRSRRRASALQRRASSDCTRPSR